MWQEQNAWAQNFLALMELELDLKGRQAFGRRKWAFQGPEQSMAARLGWEGQGSWRRVEPGLRFAQGERSAELGECSHAVVLRYSLRECRECSSNGS